MSKFSRGKTKASKVRRVLAVCLAFIVLLVLQAGVISTAATNQLPKISGLPTTLEAPKNLSAVVKKYDGGMHYFELKWTNTAGAAAIHKLQYSDAPLSYQIDYKIGNGKWTYETEGNLISTNSMHDGEELCTSTTYNPIEQGTGEDIDVKANTYYLRIRYAYEYSDDSGDYKVYSAFSNIFTIGVTAYKGASSWATPELDRAAKYGLITDAVKEKMNGPITREEFAELAVRLYEVYTGKKATYSGMSAFTDTKNPEIFKAFTLKIIEGTNPAKKIFSPKLLTNREQVATMLCRAVKAIKPQTDFSTAGAPKFSDEKIVSNWALDSVKFMSKQGFIEGSGGKFDPKGTCTREAAVIIAMRVYEKYTGK